MLAKRIIACLDVKDGRTVKGVQFENLRDMGDPVELAAYYADQGVDELVFLDISATNEKRKTLAELVRRIAKAINIPFTVGGGISNTSDVKILLGNGADKVTVNSAAIRSPQLVKEVASEFGSQCLVVAVDTSFRNGDWYVFANGGREETGLLTKTWINEVVSSGAGEILLTSMDHDGTRNGFATGLTKEISEMVAVPVIASGGAGKPADFEVVFEKGKADAALAAGIFHEKLLTIPELKNYLRSKKIAVR
jgi:imidazole glycerol-phosphate synthase subunit HisF